MIDGCSRIKHRQAAALEGICFSSKPFQRNYEHHNVKASYRVGVNCDHSWAGRCSHHIICSLYIWSPRNQSCNRPTIRVLSRNYVSLCYCFWSYHRCYLVYNPAILFTEILTTFGKDRRGWLCCKWLLTCSQ